MIFVVLPAYNEGRGIKRLVESILLRLREFGEPHQLIIVDDGSIDDTNEQITQCVATEEILVIRHRYNRGLGETIRDAIEYAVDLGKSGDIIIRMDADETHNPLYFKPMIEQIRNGADVVIASRFASGGKEIGVPPIRKLLSRGANLLIKLFFYLPNVTDYACGFRAYKWEALKTAIDIYKNDFIELKGLGFTGTVEKLIKIRRLGFHIIEIPFKLDYDMKLSESKMSSRVTMLGYFVLILKQIYPWGAKEKKIRQAIAEFRKQKFMHKDG